MYPRHFRKGPGIRDNFPEDFFILGFLKIERPDITFQPYKRQEEEVLQSENDWKFVAMVIDRCFLWIFVLGLV